MNAKNKLPPAPEGKKFYGSVTVSKRGQIVIPSEAREDFGINAGDKILVFGDLKTGLWITTLGILENNMVEGGAALLSIIQSQPQKSGKDD